MTPSALALTPVGAGLEFVVFGVAEPKGSARAFVPKGWRRAVVTSANPSLKGWEQTVRHQLQRVMAETPPAQLAALFDAPVVVALEFHLPRPKSLPKRVTWHTKKPDVDKLARGTVDALNGVLVADDAHVVELRARKVYAASVAKVVIRIDHAREVSATTNLPSRVTGDVDITSRSPAGNRPAGNFSPLQLKRGHA